MNAKDFRKQAWGALRGNWGVMIVALLIYTVIDSILAGLSRYVIGGVLLLLVTGPLTLGNSKMSLNLVRDKKVEIPMLFDGFKDMSRAIILAITNNIFIFLWSLLLIIPGIIKQYAYSMSFFVLLDNPNMTANEARKESMRLMKGNKWRLFCLHLSYIGWYLLSIITFGILFLWVIPSIRTAEAAFYNSLAPEVVAEDGGETFDGLFNEDNEFKSDAETSDSDKKDSEPFDFYDDLNI